MKQPPQSDKTSRAERLLAEFHEEKVQATPALDGKMLRDLWPYARPHRRLYLGSLLLMPIGLVTTLLQPRLLEQAVNSVGVGQSGDALRSVALAFALVISVRLIAGFAETYLLQLAGQRTMAGLRSAAFAHIQKLSLSYFDRVPVGRIVTRVTNDIDSLGELFASGAVTVVADVCLLVGIVVTMLSIDWQLSLIAFLAVPPLVLAVEWLRRKLRRYQRVIRAKTAQLNAYLNEQVQGIEVVQAFSREKESALGYREINQAYREAFRNSIRTDATMYSVVEAISAVCIGLVLFYAAKRVGIDAAANEAAKGTFVAFYAYIQLFFVPLRDLSSKYTMIQSALASAERVFGLLQVREFDANAVDVRSRGRVDVAAGDEVIAFHEVDFRYTSAGPWVLKQVSFEVRRGETIAIVGATGAGKTTITGLVQRFYEVSAGQVRAFGRDVRDYRREELRRRFAFVQQDPFLFTGSLLSNIALGEAQPSAERAERALAQLGAHALFQARGGLHMEIKERGANLSSGERQLIAFARALYRDPDVLILDEATASIDSETEATIQQALEVLLEGRTAVIIAHRLSTIRRASRILVFSRGQLVEQGKHAELLAQKGVYAKLHDLQFEAAPRPDSVAAPTASSVSL